MMPDAPLEPDTSPVSSRPALTRLGHVLLGACAGGVVGTIGIVLATPRTPMPAVIAIGGLALLGALLGYRFGRGVGTAAYDAFTGGAGPV